MRTKKIMRRISRYKKFFDEPALQDNILVLQYRHQMDQASQHFTGCRCYVPGDTIEGDVLRSFASEPIISGPIVCQLCDDASFLYDDDSEKHQRNVHCGVNEYRKRVLFLQEQRGPRAITGEEKRIIVQNFAHFQQFSKQRAKSNTFARIPEVPRCEAVCALCARKDFIEHRHMLNLFAQPPEDQQRVEFDSRGAPQLALTGHEGAEQEEEEVEAHEEDNSPKQFIKHNMFIIYKIQKRSIVYSALSDTQHVGLSFVSQSCTLPACNILYIRSGDGCCTADACHASRVISPAALLRLPTSDLVVLASETRIGMFGVAGTVSWTL